MREEVEDKEIRLMWTITAKNGLMMKGGFSPNQLVFGRNPYIPNIIDTEEPSFLERGNEIRLVRDHLNAMYRAREIHVQQESSEKMRRALIENVREHKIEEAEIGE